VADNIGTGILTPFRRGPNDFVSGGGTVNLQSMVGQILGTRASSDYTGGELPWRPEFGSLLHLLRHRSNDQATRELARVWVGEALARWLPQVRVTDVDVRKALGPGGDESVVSVQVTYEVVALNRTGSSVLAEESATVTFSAA
jgi:phage baseplate assembly protein W